MNNSLYLRLKKHLNVSENGIVGFWDVVTKVLSYISLLEIVLAVNKRWILQKKSATIETTKNENGISNEGKKDNNDSLYELIEIWVIAHVFLAIIASAITFYDLTPDNRIMLYVLSAYGSIRVFEIIIKQIRVIMFDTIGEKAVELKSARRSIILLIHNVVEMIFWFSVSLMAVCLLKENTLNQSFTHLSDLFYWSDFIKCSTLQFTTFGDDYTTISGLIGNQNIFLVNITFWEILVGFIIIVISLARFFSLLPPVKTLDDRK